VALRWACSWPGKPTRGGASRRPLFDTRAQLIDILADYAVFTATINNDHGGAPQNTNKGDYVGLYSTYPMNSRKYPAFSLSVMFDRMNVDIARAAEIASFCVPVAGESVVV